MDKTYRVHYTLFEPGEEHRDVSSLVTVRNIPEDGEIDMVRFNEEALYSLTKEYPKDNVKLRKIEPQEVEWSIEHSDIAVRSEDQIKEAERKVVDGFKALFPRADVSVSGDGTLNVGRLKMPRGDFLQMQNMLARSAPVTTEQQYGEL